MTDLELAYVAGLFDGEGCISLTGLEYVQFHVYITMTHKETVAWVQSTFGGTLRPRKPTRGAVRVLRQVWEWRIGAGAGATSFLTSILPYSRTKASQIEIALEFLRLPSRRQDTTIHTKQLRLIAMLQQARDADIRADYVQAEEQRLADNLPPTTSLDSIDDVE